MTKRSTFLERSWRCCAAGCADFLTMSYEDYDEPPEEDRAMYLLFNWGNGPRSWRDRLVCIWRILRYGKDDWYEFLIDEPHTAREMAAWLSRGALALERKQAPPTFTITSWTDTQ